MTRRLDQLFAGWLLTRLESEVNSPDIVIACTSNGVPPDIPIHLEAFEIAEEGLCYLEDTGFYLDLGHSVVHLLSNNSVRVELWLRDGREIQTPDLARALSFAVCAGLRRYGIFDVHGAGVVHAETGNGVLIIGHSGSGKSTLSTQLIASGWDYLSDDETLLTLEDNGVVARGFRSFFALSEETLLATGVDSLNCPAANRAGIGSKTCFEPTVLFESNHVECAMPRGILFTRVAGRANTEILELSQSETMARLVRACPWATYDRAIAAENLHTLSRLARQSRGFDLAAGIDLLTPGHADVLLRPILEST